MERERNNNDGGSGVFPSSPLLRVGVDEQSGSVPMSMPGLPAMANPPSGISLNNDELASENEIEMERPPSVSTESR